MRGVLRQTNAGQRNMRFHHVPAWAQGNKPRRGKKYINAKTKCTNMIAGAASNVRLNAAGPEQTGCFWNGVSPFCGPKFTNGLGHPKKLRNRLGTPAKLLEKPSETVWVRRKEPPANLRNGLGLRGLRTSGCRPRQLVREMSWHFGKAASAGPRTFGGCLWTSGVP